MFYHLGNEGEEREPYETDIQTNNSRPESKTLTMNSETRKTNVDHSTFINSLFRLNETSECGWSNKKGHFLLF